MFRSIKHFFHKHDKSKTASQEVRLDESYWAMKGLLGSRDVRKAEYKGQIRDEYSEHPAYFFNDTYIVVRFCEHLDEHFFSLGEKLETGELVIKRGAIIKNRKDLEKAAKWSKKTRPKFR